jgi:hypothetical protein
MKDAIRNFNDAHKTMQATTSEGSSEIKHKLLSVPLVYGSFYEETTSAHEGTYLHMSILRTSVHTQQKTLSVVLF